MPTVKTDQNWMDGQTDWSLHSVHIHFVGFAMPWKIHVSCFDLTSAHALLNSWLLGKFMSSADFFQNQLLRKILSGLGIPSECQTDWIEIRPDNFYSQALEAFLFSGVEPFVQF